MITLYHASMLKPTKSNDSYIENLTDKKMSSKDLITKKVSRVSIYVLWLI